MKISKYNTNLICYKEGHSFDVDFGGEQGLYTKEEYAKILKEKYTGYDLKDEEINQILEMLETCSTNGLFFFFKTNKVEPLTHSEKMFLAEMKDFFFRKYESRIKSNDLKEIWGDVVDEYRTNNCNPILLAKKKAEELIEQFMERR